MLNRARAYEIEVASPYATSDALAPPLTSVLGDPELTDDAAYLGHMLNDGATCPSDAMRAHYDRESSLARNVDWVQLEGCHLAIVTRRDVRRGEELLLTYGAPFWLAELNAIPTPDEEEGSGVPHRRRRGRARRKRGGSFEDDEWSDDDWG